MKFFLFLCLLLYTGKGAYNMKDVISNISGQKALNQCSHPDWLFDKKTFKCYLKMDMIAKTYSMAKQICTSQGYQLPMIKTQKLATRLLQYFNTSSNFWIGAQTQELPSGTQEIKWWDGTKLDKGDAMWAEGSPQINSSSTDDECVYLDAGLKRLKLGNCSTSSESTCEVNITDRCAEKPRCQHICLPGRESRLCECRQGYHLLGQTRCVDIDECIYQNGHCEQRCTNLEGSYNCSCDTGTPVLNGRVCRDPRAEEGRDKDYQESELGPMIVLTAILFPLVMVIACILVARWRYKTLTTYSVMDNRVTIGTSSYTGRISRLSRIFSKSNQSITRQNEDK